VPIFLFTFTDTSTLEVNAATPADALTHVQTLLTIAQHTTVNAELKGKALASTTPLVVDKYKERDAANKAARG